MSLRDRIGGKARSGARLIAEEGLFLLTEADLMDLAEWATAVRFRKNPERNVTFVVDSNPNYTNVCASRCSFCAFYRDAGAPDAWTLTVEEVLDRVKQARDQGATTVLLQGGLHPSLPLEYYTTLVRETRKRFPGVTPHYFSAPEVWWMAKRSGRPLKEILQGLKEAGQTTLPGGGAEILSEPIRSRVSPEKCGVGEWLEVHRQAHRLGFRSTATMMFGHGDEPRDRLSHLEALRALQDETGGFTAFIPWTFKPRNSAMERQGSERNGGLDYLRVLASARLFLDNFEHVQASWFSEGRALGEMALYFGADDFGGILLEENVHRASGHVGVAGVEDVKSMIERAGFRPCQRDTLYQVPPDVTNTPPLTFL